MFFEHTMDDLLERELREMEDRVTKELWSSYAELSITMKTDGSVSSLLQRIKGKVFPVSKYFMFRAYEKLKGELVKSLKAAAEAADNPAMRGWAFELEQIHIVTKQLETARFVANNDGSLCIPVSKDSIVTYNGKRLTGDTNKTKLLVKCTKWNQGCFDLAFVFDDHLVSANFTISHRHSLKVRYIRYLKRALEAKGRKITKVTHVGVLDDAATLEKFMFTGAEVVGHGNGQPLYTIKTRAGLEFVEPDLGMHNPGGSESRTPQLGKTLGTVKIFANRRSDRKNPKKQKVERPADKE